MQNELSEEFSYDLNHWTRVAQETYKDVSVVPRAGALAPALCELVRLNRIPPQDLQIYEHDVFVLGLGEPARRDVTKIGGLPYRPRTQPWPHFCDQPYELLAQVRLVESRDIVRETPGDFLLLFALVSDGYLDLVFEWQNLGISDLPTAADIPPPRTNRLTAYGVRYRAREYWPRRGEPFGYSWSSGFPCYITGAISTGPAVWVPPDLERYNFAFSILLCTPITFGSKLAFPFVNHPAPLGESDAVSPAFRVDTRTDGVWVGIERNGTLHYHAQPSDT